MPRFKSKTSFEEKVTLHGNEIEVKGIVRHPLGWKPNTFVVNLTRALSSLADNEGQSSLDFSDSTKLNGATIVVDIPRRTRKTIDIRLTVPVGGTDGYKLQSTLFALSQTKKKVNVKVIECEAPKEKETLKKKKVLDKKESEKKEIKKIKGSKS